jgi:hypothetical protein
MRAPGWFPFCCSPTPTKGETQSSRGKCQSARWLVRPLWRCGGGESMRFAQARGLQLGPLVSHQKELRIGLGLKLARA